MPAPRGGFVPHPAHPTRTSRAPLPGVWHALLAIVGLSLALGPLALAVNAAGTLTMDARVLLQGHARTGSWTAIEISLQNDGPQIRGELRMDGGAQSRARYSMAVDLPTNSRQTYVLHAQPPAFARNATITLVSGDQALESVTVAYLVHDAGQLVVGVLAEQPQGIVAELKLPASATGAAAVVVPLSISDLPETPEGWSTLDRLVWQDIDSNQLSTLQLDAMRKWLAAGGRLVIAAGSAGINTLSSFPDDLLPYRPTATIDLDPSNLVNLLGPLPAGAEILPAMAGELARGHALVTSGDRVVAAELTYGSGRVSLIGFDPTTRWLAESKSVDGLWRGLLPPRSGDGTLLGDDSQLMQAIYLLPGLALPPISGLLLILAGYIVVIGPINYLILRRLDRRELAWITMPVLVLAFTTASYGYGFFLRGTDVVVNQVAIVRGAPDATEATAQVFFGVFSPTRSNYLVEVSGGALLAAPISGDPFTGQVATLDIVQGTGPQHPSAVRNMTLGTGALGAVRAQVSATAPRMRASLDLVDGVLTGTFENASDDTLEGVAIVLGSSAVVLGDVPAHQKKPVKLAIATNLFGSSLAAQIVGSVFESSTDAGIRRSTRFAMVNQLTYDPSGMSSGRGLPGDQAVILAFGRKSLLAVQVSGTKPREQANVLYYVPITVGIRGAVVFEGDLLRSTVIGGDAQFFNRERSFLGITGAGNLVIAYRPIQFDGTFSVSELRLALGSEGVPIPVAGGKPVEPRPTVPVPCTDVANTAPEGCAPRRDNFLPEVDVFDLTGQGTWVRLPRIAADAPYTLTNPGRYVDPATGQVLIRFVNDNPDSSVGFGFQLSLDGEVK
jgi:hypothetical protein